MLGHLPLDEDYSDNQPLQQPQPKRLAHALTDG